MKAIFNLSLIILLQLVIHGHVNSQQSQLFTTPFQEHAFFGTNDIDYFDDRFISGANVEGQPGYSNSGAAYIFRRDICGWVQEFRILPPVPEEYGDFGYSSAINNTYAAVGAPYYNMYKGEVHTYQRSGTTWSSLGIIQIPTGYVDTVNTFGIKLSFYGDKLLIGARGYMACLEECFPPEPATPGFGFLYEYDGTTWQLEHVFHESGASDAYGSGLDIHGNTVVIGDELQDNIYIYEYDGALWNLESTMTRSGNHGGDVVVENDTIVAGAQYESGNTTYSGAAYVYDKSSGSWGEIQKLIAYDGTDFDLYGRSVDLQNGIIAIGADQATGSVSTIEGAAYVYESDGISYDLFFKNFAENGASGLHYSNPIALAKDELLCGADAHQYNPLVYHAGCVYVNNIFKVNEWVGGTGNWNDPANWDLNEVPNKKHHAYISNASDVVTISDMDALAQTLKLEDGTLNITSAGKLTLDINYQQKTVFNNDGGTLDNNGIIDFLHIDCLGDTASFLNQNMGDIINTGTMNSMDATILNMAVISPGNSPGLTTINASLKLDSGSDLQFEIAGNAGAGIASGHDQITIDGDLVTGGNLSVVLIGGFTPNADDQYTLISYTGTIDQTTPIVVDISGLPVDWAISYDIPGEVIVHGPNAELPIDLLSFIVKKRDDFQSQLNWTTASELNNEGFHVQHSTDGIIWKDISWINGAGQSTFKKQYEYIHESPTYGKNYYRLKQKDYDGSMSYSIIKSINWDKSGQLDIFPNPAQDQISVLGLKAGNAVVEIYNNTGQLLFNKNYNHDDREDISIPVSELESGFYILTIEQNNNRQVQQLIISK